VNRDHYAGAAAGWARGATLVYAPIATLLVARTPVALQGTRVLDVGAGTGVCEAPLRAAGTATIVAADLSYHMLAWNRADRPPAVVSDVMRLPVPRAAFDAAVASFVLNHLTDPVHGFAELARVVRSGGALLATVYASSSQSANRDTVDEMARAHGWVPPQWYTDFKATAAPLLGTCGPMRAAAAAAALVDVVVDEEVVDVGVTEPGALVDYRFGQAQFAGWLAALTPDARTAARAAAARAIANTMEPYRPRVIFLTARTAP
jgi:ubiquinone/menaquinone biosynthesis C-methylase UbiE